MASTQIPNYETRSLANNLKSKNQELSSLFMTHRINAMHALIKFPEYIPYGLGVMAWTRSGTYGQTDGRTDRWMYGTDRGNTKCPSAILRIGGGIV